MITDYMLYLTSGVEADWLATNKGDLITTEVCTQHLTFDQDDVEKLGVRALMNPPIRYTEDRDTLWNRLKDGTIDCVVTDHAPHTLDAKSIGYPNAPAGMPGVETSLPLMLTHAIDGKCSVSDVVSWMCAGPAKVYGIEKKGSLIEGYDGDLTLVDLDTRHSLLMMMSGRRLDGHHMQVWNSPTTDVDYRGWRSSASTYAKWIFHG